MRRENNAAHSVVAAIRIPFQVAQEGSAEEGLLGWSYKPIWERSQSVTPNKTWRENTVQVAPAAADPSSMLNDALHGPQAARVNIYLFIAC